MQYEFVHTIDQVHGRVWGEVLHFNAKARSRPRAQMGSPNPDFIRGAFGETYEDFLEILSMPDRYIIYRSHYGKDSAADWKREFNRLSAEQKAELLDILQELNSAPRERPKKISSLKRPFRSIIEHYYPGGQTAPKTPEDEILAQQGVSVGYDSGPR